MIVLKNMLSKLFILTIFAAVLSLNVFASYEEVIEGTSGQQKEFLTNLLEKFDSPDDCYDLIKRRFLDGYYEDASIALDLKNSDGEYIFPGYKFALLRAQCAGAIFVTYSRNANPSGWPSEEHGVELRRLARNATNAYEEAFRLAPSDFDKAYVYARWHELHTQGRFEADSLLLRSGSPLEKINEPIDEKLQEQLSILRPVIAKSLEEALAENKLITAETKQSFVDVMVNEYKILGRIGAPDNIFNEIIEDIPEFLDKAINESILREPEKYHISLQYHLWYALTGPRPDEIDKEYIDNLVDNIDKQIHEKFKTQLPEYEETASNTFLEIIRIVRENRFVPRFKQPVLSYHWPEATNTPDIAGEIEKSIARIIDRNNQEMSQNAIIRRTFEEVQAKIQRNAKSEILSLTASIDLKLMNDHRIQHYLVPPGVTVSGSSGTTHDKSGIWVFTASENAPVPPYPWKKDITAIDASTSDTKRIAARVIEALNKPDLNSIYTMLKESRGFLKQDAEKLIEELGNYSGKIEPVFLQDANNIFVEDQWSWSIVRAQIQENQITKSLYCIFHYNDRMFWLAWAGFLDETPKTILADLLQRTKPRLELQPVTEPVQYAEPILIDTIDDIAEMESLEAVEAGSDWKVQLATISASDIIKDLADEGQSSWNMLYCKATWNNANKPPKTIPYGRFEGQHLGPVVWTINTDGFRETPLSKISNAVPPVSVQGNGSMYAAVLPIEQMKEVYLQVYSAIDGRELARQHITQPESTQTWGRFMTYEKDKYFGVPENFAAARPTMPPFIPFDSSDTKTSMKLKLDNGFFELKTDERIISNQGSRLLARWWINGEPVTPEIIQDVNLPGYTETEGLANTLRLPAAIPVTGSKIKQGDKIELQVMLCPDSIKSTSSNKLNDFSLDDNELPCSFLLSNKISFKVDSKMLAKRKSQTVTAGQFKALTDAIENGNVKKVKSLLEACPELVFFRDTVKTSALDFVCKTRPKARQFFVITLGGHINAQYWKTMSEIAGILIDYGSEINTEGRISDTPLQALLEKEDTNEKDKAIPTELVRLLIDRGAILDTVQARATTNGTILQQTVKIIQSYNSDRLVPIVKILLEYGADVFATNIPWHRESVYKTVDSLKQKGLKELADLIIKTGNEQQKSLESKVILGTDQFLSCIRYAGQKELEALGEELPIEEYLNWVSVGRSLQRELGPELRTISDIENIYLKGDYAEVIISTGLEGSREYLTIILMKYPNGDYHAIHADVSAKKEYGRSIYSPDRRYSELINGVYYRFGQLYNPERGGGMSGGMPSRVKTVKLSIENGCLVAQGINLPSSEYFYVMLLPDRVFLWRGIWRLYIAKTINFSNSNQTLHLKSFYMADGCITINNAEQTTIFSVSGDKIIMDNNGQKSFNSEFIIDLETLEIKNND